MHSKPKPPVLHCLVGKKTIANGEEHIAEEVKLELPDGADTGPPVGGLTSKEPGFEVVKWGRTATDNLSMPCTDFNALSAALEANLEDTVRYKGTTVNLNRLMTTTSTVSKLTYDPLLTKCTTASMH